jgi:4-oxalocrotonate tautomerase family enzyme
MPLVKVEIIIGKTKEYKKQLLGSIHMALIDTLEIEETDVFIIIHEPPLDNWGCYGVQASELDLHYKRN